jgi:hypothetical protein
MLSNKPIDLSEDGLPAVNWADEEAVMSHVPFAAINSKKHLKLPAKRVALAAFVDVKPTTMFSKLMPDDGSLVIKALEHLKITGKKEGDPHRFWNQIYVAGMLTRLFILVCKNEELLAVQHSGMGLRQRPQVHPAVTTLKKLVSNAIAKAASSAVVESSKSSRGLQITVCQCPCSMLFCRDQRFKLALEEKKRKLDCLSAPTDDQNPIGQCDEWLGKPFQNAHVLAVADAGANVEQNAWGIAARMITGDLSSPLGTNLSCRLRSMLGPQ